jgi:hypothetical protein
MMVYISMDLTGGTILPEVYAIFIRSSYLSTAVKHKTMSFLDLPPKLLFRNHITQVQLN